MLLTIKDKPLSLTWQFLGFVSYKFAAIFLNSVSAYSSGYKKKKSPGSLW